MTAPALQGNIRKKGFDVFRLPSVQNWLKSEAYYGVWLDATAHRIPVLEDTAFVKWARNDTVHPLKYIKRFRDKTFDGILYNASYTSQKIRRYYTDFEYRHNSASLQYSLWVAQKQEFTRLLKPHGKIISVGWDFTQTSPVFTVVRTLVFPYVKGEHFVVCTVETKR